MELIRDDFIKVYTPLGAMSLILVDFSKIGRSTADPSPASLGHFVICICHDVLVSEKHLP